MREYKRPPIVCVVGTSDSGKTTLLEKIIPELKTRGYRVAVVKHDVHGFDMDKEGKDSWRLKRAGADAIVVSSPTKIALIEDVDHDLTLDELRERLRLEVDIILTEGYKRESYPKIEVFRQAHGRGLLCSDEEELIAIASDSPIEVGNARWLHIDDAKAIADFLEERFSLKEKGR